MNTLYDEDYFERGEATGKSLYSNYHWMPVETLRLAHHLVINLHIKRYEKILDFGCAKGFLVKALRTLNYKAFGYDISSYALSLAPEEIKPFLFSTLPHDEVFDWILAKDVLEHVSYEELPKLLENLRKMTKHMFVLVPLGNGSRYFYPEYEKDVTHVIREDIDWWCKAFIDAGFFIDSGRYEMPYVKENCPRPQSNGFFVLTSSPF